MDIWGVKMRIYDNGIYRDMTAAEIAELEKMHSEAPEPEPTPEERIKELEEQLKAVTTILLGGDE